jgi:hypothetical protein
MSVESNRKRVIKMAYHGSCDDPRCSGFGKEFKITTHDWPTCEGATILPEGFESVTEQFALVVKNLKRLEALINEFKPEEE